MQLPNLIVPDDIAREEMPDLLRHWYLGTPARRHMMLRRFYEVDRELDATPGQRVLDIGSAWGYNVMALRKLGYEAVAMDIVVDQFATGQRIATANGVDLPALGADAARLPFASEVFDRITMVETFEHIFVDDRPAAMAECYRVLKPGGRIVLSTPNYASAVESLKRFTGNHPWLRKKLPTMCYPEEGMSREDYHPYRYHHPMSDEQIATLLRGAGFAIERRKHFLFTLKNTPDWAAGLTKGLERVAEFTPGIKGRAATVCFVALRP